MDSTIILTLGGVAVAFIAERLFRQWNTQRKLPPGPAGWPLVGNFKDVTSAHLTSWEHFLTFKRLYGPISSITTMGNTVIVLNDAETAEDLLEKRSGATAGRPRHVVASEMASFDRTVVFKSDPSDVRTHRKYMAQYLGSNTAVKSFTGPTDFETRKLLLRLLNEPEGFRDHIRRQAGTQILKIVYGYNVEPSGDDKLVRLVETVMGSIFDAVLPGKWLPDAIPILKYVPPWVPGAKVQRLSRDWRAIIGAFGGVPYDFTKGRMAKNEYEDCYVSKHLEEGEPDEKTDAVIKWTAAIMYLGGADTTTAVLANVILAMAINPEVQRKAQLEIDEKIGRDRLPTIEDRDAFPYIRAIVSEALRWHPVTPLVTPHATTEDIEYRNYVIPKGSTIVPNAWAMTHDPDYYRDPMTFDPDRYLEARETPEPDPRKFIFGFGRRICPGRYFAEATLLFTTVADIISVFSITKPIKDGEEVELDPGYKDSMVSAVNEFEVVIQPRHENSESLVRAVEREEPFIPGDSKELDWSQLDGVEW